MSSLGVKKTIRTYSRQSKRSSYDEEPPTKRRRVELSVESTEIKNLKSGMSSSPDRSPQSTRDASAHPISSPKNSPAIFSDEVAQSTPPSSSPPRANSPPVYQTRRPVFSIFKPRAKPEQLKKTPLSERNQNTQDEQKMPPKKRRLVQMQLDLVGEVRKMCKICGMEYIPSNPEDASIHRKFHAMNVGGLDFTKVFVERLRRNQIWAGGDGSFIAVIGRRDALALRNRATDVLQLVNTELAAVPISAEALWGQIHIPISANARVQGEKTQTTILGKPAPLTGDRFKMFLYIRGHKCVGACLAERIYEAYAVLDQDDASGQPGVRSGEEQSSSVSIGSTTQAAIMGISRIWTSTSHRKQGVATALLDSARAHFLYGMTIDKEKVAFSQPTASGGQLARKWFGRSAGWHVYID